MSENIQSISQGTYTIGQTSATNFVAGPGIKIDQPSAGTVRIGNDETVLFENSSGTNGNTNITLSESISNFEYVQIDYSVWDDEKATQILPVQSSQYQLNTVWFDNASNFYHFCDVLTITGTTYTLIKAAFHNFNSTSVNVDGDAKKFFKTYKVIGINRISGGNE